MEFLRVNGKEIRNGKGEKTMLRGVCLGGWLNMENFITGYPGAEEDLRDAVSAEFGEERSGAFFRAFLDSFVTEGDFKFLRGLGATAVRVPFGCRHFTVVGKAGDRFADGVYDEGGFHYLDLSVAWAKKHGLYVILDLHAAPLWQSEGWHCDNPHGVSVLWRSRPAQDWTRGLWERIASRYRDEPAVAGYNLLNEPNVRDPAALNRLYRDWIEAVRRIDRKHIIFLDGNDYARSFEGFDEPFDENTVYSSHNYTAATHSGESYPGEIEGVLWDKVKIEAAFRTSNDWILSRSVPGWVGEFGALYDGELASPSPADRARLDALADQLDVFARHDHHWTIWTYKDVDVMGLVAPPTECEYLARIAPVLDIKHRLGIDAWTARGRSPLAGDLTAFADRLAEALPGSDLDFKAFRCRLVHVGYYALTAGFLSPLFARRFKDMTPHAIEKMMAEAFLFTNCRQRTSLNEVLSKAMKSPDD
ncbi:MAG: cellulase family glycosylhydrolase [Spirochaetales bacterium]|nr:cellulase family glycosylhydrolase [Spirochaetales bacterium]